MSSGAGVHDDCITHFNDLKLKKTYRYILYKFSQDLSEIVIDKAADREAAGDYEKFVEQLPANECRYALYDLDYELEGGEGKRSKICFISWAPDTAPIKHKMVFAASKDALKRRLVGVATEIQATDLSEVEYEAILDKARQRV